MIPTRHFRCTAVAACLFMVGAATLFARPVAAQELHPAVAAAEAQRVAAVGRAIQSTVCVFDSGGQGGGSGVLISADGFALTNFHVVKPCGNHMKCGLADGKLYDAVIVGIDPTGDVALIQLLGRTDFPPAVLADSDAVRVGDFCFAVGNPFLLATDLQPTVSYGLVSGTHRYQYPSGTLLEYADCIQTDAAINPGNSGGPLFNSEGQLIGVNGRGSFEKRGRVNVGVGYAISINQIKKFLGQLHGGRIVDHATIGASVSTDDQGRVVVTNILESSDAYRRGLRYGDEIVSFGGRPVTTVNGFKNALGIFPKSWRVPVTFRRQDVRVDVFVRLAGVHRAEELIEKTGAQEPGDPHPEKKPGEKDPEKKPGDKDPPDSEEPQEPAPGDDPVPKLPGKPKAVPMPAEVKKRFEARAGYANYYYNKLHRDRVWNAFAAKGNFSAAGSDWNLAGDLGGVDFKALLGDKQIVATLGEEASLVDLAKNLDEQLDPQNSGGLLVALHLWQRFLVNGPTRYGEVYYLGTSPLPHREGLCDVLVATHGPVECRFYFDPTTGELVLLEMFPDADVDPCEIAFGDYRAVHGRQMPHSLDVKWGDRKVGQVKVKSWTLPAAGKEKTS